MSDMAKALSPRGQKGFFVVVGPENASLMTVFEPTGAEAAVGRSEEDNDTVREDEAKNDNTGERRRQQQQ